MSTFGLPIQAPTWVSPADVDSDDERAVLLHVIALLEGAESWLELLQIAPLDCNIVNALRWLYPMVEEG